MKYKVKIDDQLFEVEIGNLKERPIIARIDDEVFEVWPESRQVYTSIPSSRTQKVIKLEDIPAKSQVNEKPVQKETPTATNVVKAPIPGIITGISIQPGDFVRAGQELFKLEAMKMINSIRAVRSGTISVIRVSVGQKVKHGEILLEFVGEQG